MAESVRDGLEILAQGEYFGRGIIAGYNTHGDPLVAYFVTGRSPPSQARRFAEENGSVRMEVTDPEQLKQGNPALLLYNALQVVGNKVVVSNGAQTDVIANYIKENPRANARAVLQAVFSKPHNIGEVDVTAYEPDEPNYTPRISAVLSREGGAMISVRRGANGEVDAGLFGIRPKPGAHLLTTYTGENKKPLPSYTGAPIPVALQWADPLELVGKVHDALGVKGKDYRVGVFAARFANDSMQNYELVLLDKKTGDLATRGGQYGAR